MRRKPTIEAIPLETGLGWRGGADWLFQEKSDGRHQFATLPLMGELCVLNAESMPDGSLVANDLLSIGADDWTTRPTIERWSELNRLFKTPKIAPFQDVKIARAGHGGEFLEAILAEGGEGVVAKPWHAPFGVNWFKCKRCQVFYCRIVDLNHWKGSARIEYAIDDAKTQFADGGWLALHSKFESVRVGQWLKVEAFGLTKHGKLREARLEQILTVSRRQINRPITPASAPQ